MTPALRFPFNTTTVECGVVYIIVVVLIFQTISGVVHVSLHATIAQYATRLSVVALYDGHHNHIWRCFLLYSTSCNKCHYIIIDIPRQISTKEEIPYPSTHVCHIVFDE